MSQYEAHDPVAILVKAHIEVGKEFRRLSDPSPPAEAGPSRAKRVAQDF